MIIPRIFALPIRELIKNESLILRHKSYFNLASSVYMSDDNDNVIIIYVVDRVRDILITEKTK